MTKFVYGNPTKGGKQQKTHKGIALLMTLFGLFQFGCGAGEIAFKEGNKAPDFVLKSQDGVDVRLSDYAGTRNVVLYFYPKDDTPGCTKEACSFRDFIDEFHTAGAEVLGVSVDDVISHSEFQEKYDLNFPLLADPDKKVTRLYGVLGTFGWAKRVTFVIDKEGIIRKIYPNVDVSVHSQEVLAFLNALQSNQDD